MSDTDDAAPGYVFEFSGAETDTGQGCPECGLPYYVHDKERVTDDRGPAGSYYYKRVCPTED